MQSTDIPAKYLVPFARDDASKIEVPVTSPDPTRFSQTLGSPPLTGVPIEAGGAAPQLPDFNGAMYQLSRNVHWSLAGGRFPFDPAWASNPEIGGYPRGAVVPAALGTGLVGMGEWYNNTQSNVTDPDSVGTGWVPGYHYGAAPLTGHTGGTITLTPALAAKPVFIISGTLTSNLIFIVPSWVYRWTVYNNTGGPFTVTIRTASTAGVTIPRDGQAYDIRCDGATVSRVEVIVPNASTTVVGTSRLATIGETGAVASATVAVTPAGLSQTQSLDWMPALVPALNAKAPINNPSFTGTVTAAGAVIAAGGFQYSSRTVKDHVSELDAERSLEQVLALLPVAWRYKGEEAVHQGYYAEDVAQVIPTAVVAAPEGAPSPLMLDNAQLLPSHTGAIQSLFGMLCAALGRIEELEKRL